MIVPLYKSERERNEHKNKRSMVGKIYVDILVDRIHRATEGLIDDKQKNFRSWKGCVANW